MAALATRATEAGLDGGALARGVRDAAASVLAVGLALGCMLGVVAALGYDARILVPAFVEGAAGNGYRLAATALLACPLCLLGLSVALSFRGGVWNIGAEGQYLIGAAAVAALGTRLTGWPAWLGVPVVLCSAALAGALWSGAAAALRAWRGVPEVLSTILLNFVAVRLVEFLVRGPLVDPQSLDRESTAAIAETAALRRLWPEGGLHAGVLVALGAVALVQVMLSRTTFGFRVRAVGASPPAARCAGIGVRRTVAALFLVCGGLAGLAGGIEVSGAQGYLTSDFAAGYGYTAIAVALLARLTPWGVLPAACFFAAIETGARGMQRLPEAALQEFPTAMKFVAQGVVVLVVLVLTARRAKLVHD